MSYTVWILTIDLVIKHLHILLQIHRTIQRLIKGIAIGRKTLPRWALLLAATFSDKSSPLETGNPFHKDCVSLEQIRMAQLNGTIR